MERGAKEPKESVGADSRPLAPLPICQPEDPVSRVRESAMEASLRPTLAHCLRYSGVIIVLTAFSLTLLFFSSSIRLPANSTSRHHSTSCRGVTRSIPFAILIIITPCLVGHTPLGPRQYSRQNESARSTPTRASPAKSHAKRWIHQQNKHRRDRPTCLHSSAQPFNTTLTPLRRPVGVSLVRNASRAATVLERTTRADGGTK